MNLSDERTQQPFRVRSATLADLQTVLHIRQSQELADGGEVFTSADRLANEWEALGDRLAEQVWVAVTPDREGL